MAGQGKVLEEVRACVRYLVLKGGVVLFRLADLTSMIFVGGGRRCLVFQRLMAFFMMGWGGFNFFSMCELALGGVVILDVCLKGRGIPILRDWLALLEVNGHICLC